MEEVSIIGLDLAKNIFQLPWSATRRIGGLPANTVTRKAPVVLCGNAALSGRDGSLRKRTPLGSANRRARTRSATYRADLCETVCEAKQE